jgi:putative transcriptional regulator
MNHQMPTASPNPFSPAKLKRSKILDAVASSAKDLRTLGFIDSRRMKAYEALMPRPIEPFSVERICALRQRLNISQPVFAALLNTSASTVKKWEAGDKTPSGASLKLLDLTERKGLEVLL